MPSLFFLTVLLGQTLYTFCKQICDMILYVGTDAYLCLYSTGLFQVLNSRYIDMLEIYDFIEPFHSKFDGGMACFQNLKELF